MPTASSRKGVMPTPHPARAATAAAVWQAMCMLHVRTKQKMSGRLASLRTSWCMISAAWWWEGRQEVQWALGQRSLRMPRKWQPQAALHPVCTLLLTSQDVLGVVAGPAQCAGHKGSLSEKGNIGRRQAAPANSGSDGGRRYRFHSMPCPSQRPILRKQVQRPPHPMRMALMAHCSPLFCCTASTTLPKAPRLSGRRRRYLAAAGVRSSASHRPAAGRVGGSKALVARLRRSGLAAAGGGGGGCGSAMDRPAKSSSHGTDTIGRF